MEVTAQFRATRVTLTEGSAREVELEIMTPDATKYEDTDEDNARWERDFDAMQGFEFMHREPPTLRLQGDVNPGDVLEFTIRKLP